MNKKLSSSSIIVIAVLGAVLVICSLCGFFFYSMLNYKPSETKEVTTNIGNPVDLDGVVVQVVSVTSLGSNTKGNVENPKEGKTEVKDIFAKGVFMKVDLKFINNTDEKVFFYLTLESQKTGEIVYTSGSDKEILDYLGIADQLWLEVKPNETLEYTEIFDVSSYLSDLYLGVRIQDSFWDGTADKSLLVKVSDDIWK